jgi:hypothetical protein
MKYAPALLGLMLVALPVEAVAATADTCLTRDEAKGLGLFILPDVIVALRDKCRAALPANAYLNGAESSERFRSESMRRWPQARNAFEKMGGGGTPMLDILGDDAVRKLLSGTITAGIAKDVKPKSCAGADKMLSALAPLPVSNFDMLIDSFFLLGLGGKDEKAGGFKICPENSNVRATPVVEKGAKK